jgi:hypothetical protein
MFVKQKKSTELPETNPTELPETNPTELPETNPKQACSNKPTKLKYKVFPELEGFLCPEDLQQEVAVRLLAHPPEEHTNKLEKTIVLNYQRDLLRRYKTAEKYQSFLLNLDVPSFSQPEHHILLEQVFSFLEKYSSLTVKKHEKVEAFTLYLKEEVQGLPKEENYQRVGKAMNISARTVRRYVDDIQQLLDKRFSVE